jgi:hypothetical protein
MFPGMLGRLFRLVEKGLQEGCLLWWTTDLQKTLFKWCSKCESQGNTTPDIRHTIGPNDNVALDDIAITKSNSCLLEIDSLNAHAKSYFSIQPSRLIE